MFNKTKSGLTGTGSVRESSQAVWFSLAFSIFISVTAVHAQSPVPGQSATPGRTPAAPLPGNFSALPSLPSDGQSRANSEPSRFSQSVVQNPAAARENFYKQLPLTAKEAEVRIIELSNRLSSVSPDALKDSIYNLCDWMQDCADAHWKMFKAFEKSPATKLQATQEKEIALKFSRLKNRAKLLKADLFIKQSRYPEALSPLVDIVVAEPSTTTGQDAYKRLMDMGFSDQIPNLEIAQTSQPQAADKDGK